MINPVYWQRGDNPSTAPANQPWIDPWTSNPGLSLVGGVATLAWSYNGAAGQPFSFCVLGKNDTVQNMQAVAAQLPYWFAQNISIHETNLSQFCDGISRTTNGPYCSGGANIGMPIYGFPGGYGAMQLDPPPSLHEVWNWKANFAAARSLLDAKANTAYSFWQRQYNQWSSYNIQRQAANLTTAAPAEQDPGYTPFDYSPYCALLRRKTLCRRSNRAAHIGLAML